MQTSQVNQMQVMEINLTALDFTLSLDQHEYVERRLSYALDANSTHICAIDVWLSELNDPDAVRNQCCLIQVTLTDGTLVIIDTIEADQYVAIHRAADRASWEVSRCLSRRNLRGDGRQLADHGHTQSGLRLFHRQASM